MKYFIGTEAEGPNRGMTTFFIRGDVTRAPSQNALQGADQIYLGAGSIRGATFELLNDLVAMDLRGKQLTIEFDSPDQIKTVLPFLSKLGKQCAHYVKLVYVIPVKDVAALDLITDIKFIDDKKLSWNVIEDAYETMLDDKLYGEDREVFV